jgi:peptidoglycan hydrolase FlgJ
MNDTAVANALTQLRASAQAPVRAPAAAATGPESVKRAAEEFEALFLAEMLAPVFESVDSDGLFGGGQGEDIYRSMMVQEYGKAIAQAGGVGIAETVQREILRMQENQQ